MVRKSRRGKDPNFARMAARERERDESKNNNPEKQREFLRAIWTDAVAARRLLEKDPRCLRYKDICGETAFHYLIIESQLDLAATLLEWGAEINTQGFGGSAPLMHAVMLGKMDVVKWLVERGASLDVRTNLGDTALSYATENGKAEIFDYLIAQPRRHPIDWYYDDLAAEQVFKDTTLVVRDRLLALGLTKRYAWDDEESCEEADFEN